MPQQIELGQIKLVQSRVKIDMATVEDYAHDMRMGTNFPAVRVVYDGETYWCYDGCHRTLAARQAKMETILASVHQGTRRDAVLRSCGVNATNGMRRTNEDKRRAVQILLDDPEWSQNSDNEIAKLCKVSQPFVSGLRQESSYNDYKIERRVVRNGTEYTMNTASIGQRSALEPMPASAPEPKVVEEDEPFTLGFPPVCPASGRSWHDSWVEGDCERCAHYRKRQSGTHGCQHPERPVQAVDNDPDNEFETEASLIVDEDDEPTPEAKTFKINVVGPLGFAPTREEKPGPEPTRLAVHFSSETPEHYTPQVVIDATLACLGEIDLDPCSNSSERPSVPASAHFTREDDGLLQPWYGRVYMNPPYGREIDQWIEKLCGEYDAGRTTEAVALVPSRTDTQWWQRLRDFPVCFVTGRLTFVGNDDPAPFPSAIFYLGENIGAFYRAFYELGDCWQRMMPGISFGE